jgi:hypothetical protein
MLQLTDKMWCLAVWQTRTNISQAAGSSETLVCIPNYTVSHSSYTLINKLVPNAEYS